MKMKSSFLVVIKAAALILCAIMAGGVILTLAYCIPVNQKLQQESYDAIKKEGWYPALPYVEDSLDTHFHSYLPGVLDGSTDSIMLSTAGHVIEGSPVEAAMRSYNDVFQYDYPRYWHGYVAVLRPLMLFFDYADIRFVNALGQLALVLSMVMHMYQKKGKAHMLMLLSSYALLMPMALQFSLQFSWVFYIAGFAGLFVMKRQKFLEQKNHSIYFFVLVGVISSYMDLLTYPLITWGVPIILWLVLCDKEESYLNYIKKVVVSGISWIGGYGGMWCGKWLLASWILGENVVQDALESIFIRLGNGEESAFSFADRLEAVYRNWKHYSYRVYFLILVLWMVWIIGRSILRGVRTTAKYPALFLVGCSGAVWYLVLSDHTATHHFFTYRNFHVSILAFMACALECLLIDKGSGTEDRSLIAFVRKCNIRKCMVTILVWVMISIGAIGLMQLAREPFLVTNWDRTVEVVDVEAGQYVETAFVPSFSKVNDFGFGMTKESGEGSYLITILDQDVEIYQEKVEVHSLGRDLYKSIPVSWDLSAGKVYTMRWQVTDTKEPYVVAVADMGDTPLREYQDLVIGDAEYNGQLLSSLNYWAIPRERNMRLFLWLTWTGVLASLVVLVSPLVKNIGKKKHGRAR